MTLPVVSFEPPATVPDNNTVVAGTVVPGDSECTWELQYQYIPAQGSHAIFAPVTFASGTLSPGTGTFLCQGTIPLTGSDNDGRSLYIHLNASNASGTVDAATQTVEITAPTSPSGVTVTTNTATSINAASATLGAAVTADANSIVFYGFQYVPTADVDDTTKYAQTEISWVGFSLFEFGTETGQVQLQPNTEYSFRGVCCETTGVAEPSTTFVPVYPAAVSVGEWVTFTTPSLVPEVLQTYAYRGDWPDPMFAGATTAVSGDQRLLEQGLFDIGAALVAGDGTFTICDNALKQALERSTVVERIA